MNFDFSNTESLLRKANSEGLYKALVHQLTKDFSLTKIDVHIYDAIEADSLQALVREKIYQLILENFEVYLQLLYVVDVPESVFKSMQVTDAVEVADQMTLLVLKREFEKVWYKKNFSS